MEISAADESAIEQGDLLLWVILFADDVLMSVEFRPVNVFDPLFCLFTTSNGLIHFGNYLDNDCDVI